MSLILDALKKLEQGKIARKGQKFELGPAIVQGNTAPSRRWQVPLLIVAAVAGTAISTMLITNIFREKQTGPAPATATAIPDRKMDSATKPDVAPVPAVTVPEPSTAPATQKTVTQQQPSVVSTPQSGATQSIPELKVSGIAWQEERSDRRAVVNGNLVNEGSVVAGCRVREIQQDRVRFVKGEQQFDVSNSSPFR